MYVHWRYTTNPVKIWKIDGIALLPIMLWLFSPVKSGAITMITFGLIGIIATLSIMADNRGVSTGVFLRMYKNRLGWWLAGGRKSWYRGFEARRVFHRL